MVELVGINKNDSDIIKCVIMLLRLNIMLFTKEKSHNVPDIGSIPISSEDYKNESNNITQEKLIKSCFRKFYHFY